MTNTISAKIAKMMPSVTPLRFLAIGGRKPLQRNIVKNNTAA